MPSTHIRPRSRTCSMRPSKAVRPTEPSCTEREAQRVVGSHFYSPGDHLQAEITTRAALLLGGRLRGFFPGVFADLILVVVKVRPLALHGRLQHYPFRSASHAEDRKDRDDDNY